MKPFLEAIAQFVLDSAGNNLHRIAVVFPNRRAGLWFQHYLSGLAGKTVWSPQIFTIRELLEEMTGMVVTDTVPLVMELYRIWDEVLPDDYHEPLDTFYPWGEMLLGDFDDLDKYLVPPADLFQNLKSLKSIEFAYLDEDQRRLIRQFWDHFPTEADSKESHSFISVWEHLAEIYKRFLQRLNGAEMAYEGMLYRKAAEMQPEDLQRLSPWDRVCFAGFHALTPAEEKLFETFQHNGNGIFFWDYDQAWLDHPGMKSSAGFDAGTFIRKYLKKFPPPVDAGVFDQFLNPAKNITVVSVPARTAQSAVVGRYLRQWSGDPGFDAGKTAVVLAEEQLLLPVVHAIPAEISEVNITMGFPVRNTAVFGLFSLFMELFIHALNDREKMLFHTRRIMDLMHHPIVRASGTGEWTRWEEDVVGKNILWVRHEDLPEMGVLAPVFDASPDAFSISESVINVMYDLLTPKEKTGNDPGFNMEGYYRLYLLVNRMNDALVNYKDLLPVQDLAQTIGFYFRLLSRIAGSLKIPFYGEPLAGIQVMGLLETRLLDFDRVILLSVNEKALPGGVTAVNSFIPYNLRKGFGMPTFDHHDTVYNYYFLRLIQRAREIVLVYHTESDGGQTGEMSRFIPQLNYLLKVALRKEVLAFVPGMSPAEEIRFDKDDAVMMRLKNLVSSGISPSALNTYIDCTLRFYFRYIVGMKEPDTLSEEMDQAGMGSLFHKAMERIYKPFTGKDLTAGILEDLRKDREVLNRNVQEAFDDLSLNFNATTKQSEGGYGNLLRHAVTRFVQRALAFDRRMAPFTIKGLEESVSRRLMLSGVPSADIQIKGKIDRIDIRGDMWRIIDYKTGRENLSVKSIGALFDPLDKNRNGSAFQILLYSWIMSEKISRDIQPQLYFLRSMTKEDPDMRIVIQKQKLNAFAEVRHDFESYLEELFLHIFNTEEPFLQTQVADRCRYCPYSEICRDRNVVLPND